MAMNKLQRLIALFGLLAFTVLSGCEGPQSQNFTEDEFKQFLKSHYFETAENDIPLASFQYHLIDGKQETLQINKGKVILLNFWATWCYPCKQEMPDLEILKHQMKGKNFRILAVNSGEELPKIASFLNKYPYSFDIILDEKRDISNLQKIVALPTTFILNRDLQMIGKITGPFDWKDETFIKYLLELSGT